MTTNKQVLRSREWITNALMKLMEHKPYTSITVSDIADEADVARITFYRNFDTKEDIIMRKKQEVYDIAMSRLNDMSGYSALEAIQSLVQVFKEYSIFFGQLIKHNLEYLIPKDFDKEISNILLKAFKINTTDPYRVKFYEGALIAVILEWMKGSMKESPKVISQYIYGYMTEVVS